MRTEQPGFVGTQDHVTFAELRAPGTQALDLPTEQRETRFLAILNEIVVGGLAVDRDRCGLCFYRCRADNASRSAGL